MIQFNLLPDVKLEYIKTRRTKRMVISVSLLVSGVALFIFLFLLVTVDVLQKKNISDLSTDIKTYSNKLEGTPNINKILTIQNQLEALPQLHDDKVVAFRLFPDIQSVTPSSATIGSLSVDFTKNSLEITGAAPNLAVVNTFTDTLKSTTYTTADNTKVNQPAFSQVVLTSFSRDSSIANYTINMTFDPVIFSNSSDVKLTVQSNSTTHTADDPGIFKGTN